MNHKYIIIKKLLLVLLVVAVLDIAIGTLLKKYYFTLKGGTNYRATFVIDSVRSDVLVLGSSRASHHYNVQLLQDSLHLTAYNGGRDGSYMFYYYAMLKSVLKRYHPKLIVLDIKPAEFDDFTDTYEHLNVLFPYYHTHPELQAVAELKGPLEKYKLLSKIYPYNSLLFSILFDKRHLKIDDSEKGFIPKMGELAGLKTNYKLKNNIDTVKVQYFKMFLNDCKAANIKVAVYISPSYLNFLPANKTAGLAKQICAANSVPFFDYTNAPQFNDGQLFYDPNHMNSTGATLYTKLVLANIKNQLK